MEVGEGSQGGSMGQADSSKTHLPRMQNLENKVDKQGDAHHSSMVGLGLACARKEEWCTAVGVEGQTRSHNERDRTGLRQWSRMAKGDIV